MADNECGCTGTNCPHKTSDVTVSDATFTNITVPAGASLNDVLALLENYTTTAAVCNDTNYTLGAFSACLNLAAGTYSFTQIIDAIVSALCANSSSIAQLQLDVADISDFNTTEVSLDGIILPSCYSTFTGITSTSLFNIILNDLCKLLDSDGPIITDTPVVDLPDSATDEPEEAGVQHNLKNARVQLVAESMSSFLDNNSFIYDHIAPVVSASSFTATMKAMRGIVDNYVTIRRDDEDLTVNASVDTYFFLSGAGYILRREVALAAPAPAPPKFSHNLYKMVSDGSGITSVVNLYETTPLNPIPLAANDVTTVTILNGAVTTAKLAAVATGATTGHPALFELVFNNEGQVTASTSNLNIAGITAGQILIYNSGTNAFDAADNTTIATATYIPKSNGAGTNYEDSALHETSDTIVNTKRAEINSGVAEINGEALLNVVGTGGGILFPRLTATQASALTGTDGLMIYVTSTNGTFVSVGFWGMEASTWVKL